MMRQINVVEVRASSSSKLKKPTKPCSRKEKIAAIEDQLYKRREFMATSELIEVLSVLQATENEQELMGEKEANSFIGQLNQVIWTALMMGAIATLMSLILYKPCAGSRSRFCSSVRVIPEAIASIFEEPKVKNKVLPRNLNN